MDKDPAIKLFGQTIPLPDAQVPANSNGSIGSCSSGTSEIPQPSELMGADGETGQSDSTDNNPNPKEVQVPSRIHRKATGQEEKVMKKPDKGILPCPRCHSRDTKFCYFNNYNVKQPRHFCRNCNRYWTAGGTTRNVPVNSGRRKNKHFASQYHQIILSATDVLPTFGIQPSYSSPSFSLSTGKDRTVLQFGSPEPFFQSSCGSSSLEASSFMENVMPKSMKGGLPSQGLGFGVHLQNPTYSYPVPPWIVTTNQGWNAAPNPTQMVAVPHFCTLTTPLEFMSGPSYWGCLPVSPAGSSLTDSSSNGFLISGNCSSPTSADNLISPSSLGWGERKERNFPASNMAGTGGTDKSSWSSIWSALATNLNQKKA